LRRDQRRILRHEPLAIPCRQQAVIRQRTSGQGVQREIADADLDAVAARFQEAGDVDGIGRMPDGSRATAVHDHLGRLAYRAVEHRPHAGGDLRRRRQRRARTEVQHESGPSRQLRGRQLDILVVGGDAREMAGGGINRPRTQRVHAHGAAGEADVPAAAQVRDLHRGRRRRRR